MFVFLQNLFRRPFSVRINIARTKVRINLNVLNPHITYILYGQKIQTDQPPLVLKMSSTMIQYTRPTSRISTRF